MVLSVTHGERPGSFHVGAAPIDVCASASSPSTRRPRYLRLSTPAGADASVRHTQKIKKCSKEQQQH